MKKTILRATATAGASILLASICTGAAASAEQENEHDTKLCAAIFAGKVKTADEWKKCRDSAARQRENNEKNNKSPRNSPKSDETSTADGWPLTEYYGPRDWPSALNDESTYKATGASTALMYWAQIDKKEGFRPKAKSNLPKDFYSPYRLNEDWNYLMNIAVRQPAEYDAKELRLRVNEMLYYTYGTGIYYLHGYKGWDDTTFPSSPGADGDQFVKYMFDQVYASRPAAGANAKLRKYTTAIVSGIIDTDFVSAPDNYPGTDKDKGHANDVISHALNSTPDHSRQQLCEIYRDLQKDPISGEGYKSGQWGAKLGSMIGRAIYCS
ncbi:hypothetical protein [Streptomyces sp. NPDC059009]|uniref:hypothetical protein n=1 Tax=Streptomyces sp. NPDC059009 TaxID=3346694 RepID=UPI003681B483